ncbi:MAG: hypothetical protein K2X03_16225 [Bryobacteraceae bacterium]|nr:hypothetical protein [Bryobacteraceae bacterium]
MKWLKFFEQSNDLFATMKAIGDMISFIGGNVIREDAMRVRTRDSPAIAFYSVV